MKLIFTSYSGALDFDDPHVWLKRIEGYTGILEALVERGHEVTGIEHINYEGALQENGVQYIFQKQTRRVQYFPKRLHRTIKRLNPDIVFINGSIFPVQLIQLRKSLQSSTRIIVIHRSEKPYKGIKGFLQARADKKIDAYLFSSDDFRDEWKNNIDIRKMHVIMHGSSVFRQEDKRAARESLLIEGSPLFLWVGRLDNNKDPLTVLKAFAKYIITNAAARLYMIYHEQPLLKQVSEFVLQNALGKNVFLVGKIPHAGLGDWYSAADFIISGSHYEGGGISVVEAVSCGCIPLITDIPSFRSVTKNGKFGFLYPPGSTDGLTEILSQVSSININNEQVKILKHFDEELSFTAIARKIEKLINNL